jgi:hypothetical protein
MKAIVVHRERGQIISLTFPHARLGTGIGVQLAPGETLLELDLPDDFERMHLTAILKEYRVDIEKKELVRQS